MDEIPSKKKQSAESMEGAYVSCGKEYFIWREVGIPGKNQMYADP